ncbi:hypothetical protein HYT55_04465 [Candidatus Woesearchaeota archaeon]|nr:hypothetical protein [Candidatus Woesearchaeota archaeon]
MIRQELKTVILGVVFLFLIGSAFAATPTLRVTETELVKLQVEGQDADKDAVTYSYSPPLNQNGEWQTNYGDAGEYNLKVTASDGSAETIQYVKLIVDRKNRSPQLLQQKVIVREGDVVNLKNAVSDPDGDEVTFTFSKPFDKEGVWKTGGEDQGSYNIAFAANDGTLTLPLEMEIEVLNVNQPPAVLKTFSDEKEVHYEEDQSVSFFAEVEDEDKDQLTYNWIFDENLISTEKNVSYYFNYSSAGKHDLRFMASDGTLNITKEWDLVVTKKNRKPEFDHIPIVVNEGEKVRIDLPKIDIDGDQVTYSYELPLNKGGEWQTGFNDSGQYRLKIRASDGQLNSSSSVEVTVLDVDQKPILIVPEEVVLFEGQEWNLTVAVHDPDSDDVFLSAENLPEGMTFINGMLWWKPKYDTIKRRGGMVSDLLNTLRLEHYLLKERIYPLTINACGKKECTSASILVRLRNVNRPPTFEKLLNATAMETETVSLAVSAIDPDGDLVHYYYTDPLPPRKAVWQTQKGDKGEHTTYVTATDGEEQVTRPVLLNIKRKNSLPEIMVEDTVKAKEGKEFTLHVVGKDKDKDPLEIKLRNPPTEASFREGVFVWQPMYNSVVNKTDSWWNSLVSRMPYLDTKLSSEKAATMLEFVISDGEAEVVHPVRVDVVNSNRAPQIVDYLPAQEVVATAGEPVLFKVTGRDADDDPLKYTWSFNLHEPRVVGTDTIERTFLAVGEKVVTVEVSDGRDSVSLKWKVNVVEKETIATETKQEPFTVQVYELDFKK